MSKVLLVLVASFCVAYAGQALSRHEPKPEKYKDQEGCYIKDLDDVIPFGESATSKTGCVQYGCGSELVMITTCGSISVGPPCKLVEDLSKPYPDCCPKPVC